ncbi:MAG TPA: DUF11 domain-containing protein, partial [Saprospiraceae bacterium]|nr:DUF11 domain-containing protein [Saprospiraceae bacterium]
ACGNLPNIILDKTFVSATVQPNGSYNVVYTIAVTNNGGATGAYTLTDTPGFDNDVTINSGSYTGEASGSLNTTGTTTLTTNNSIAAGATETFTLTFNVTLDLSATSTDGGDNVYTACGTGGPNGNGTPGQGLYNLAQIDVTGDGTPDRSDDACGNLPNIILDKTFVSATPNANGTYTVVYQVAVSNTGGATGTYTLTDTPSFDTDVVINSGNYSGPASGALSTTGASTIVTNYAIAGGATQTFTLSYNVSLSLNAANADGGDNVYTACGTGGPNGNGTPGQGLYNLAQIDVTNDGTPDRSDDACGDLPLYDLALTKTLANSGPFMQNSQVRYTITVSNEGGINATNIVVTDRPETGLILTGMTPQAGVTNNNNGTFTIASIPVGQSVSFEVIYTISSTFQGTSLTNEAEITQDDPFDDVDSTPNNDVPTEDDQDDVT